MKAQCFVMIGLIGLQVVAHASSTIATPLASVKNLSNHNATVKILNANNGRVCSRSIGIPQNRTTLLTSDDVVHSEACQTQHYKLKVHRFLPFLSHISEPFVTPGKCRIRDSKYHYKFKIDCQ